MVAAFIFVQPVTADAEGTSLQPAAEIRIEKTSSLSGNPPISKAYLRMKNDSSTMIDAMQKNIILVQKRIELAKTRYSLVCVECMERELPWMNKQLENATMWNEIMEDPGNSPLDHLEAYWAIKDTHKNVKNMKEKTDRYWRWKLDLK